MRRAGKTFLAFQKIQELLNNKIPLETILYLNFEDDRLLPMDHKEMGKLIDAFFTLYPQNHSRPCFLFLDEVQNVPDWAIVIRRFLDSKNVQIFLTGSSAKLLSKEIATSLRGRSLAVEVWPYSFSEFMQAHNIKRLKGPFGKKTIDIMRDHLLKYFQIGGFPAVQEFAINERLEVLQGYVETVIFRDIVERYQVTNLSLLRYFIHFLMKNVAFPFSINKFYNDTKSQGFKVGKDTLYHHLDYIEDAYLLFGVPLYTDSLRLRQNSPKKIYIVDDGLLLANTFNLSTNLGKLFENLVYLDLRRQGKKIFYYKTTSGFEIDFVVQSERGEAELIQVAWDIEDPETLERETRALKEAEKELGIKGRILDFKAYIANIAG